MKQRGMVANSPVDNVYYTCNGYSWDKAKPIEYEELVKLPGVGRKTANVVLAEGFGKARIAVDTHVFRVANRIGLADGKDPAEVEETLMARLPEDQWIRAHHLLIFHGRKVCHARKPDCAGCGLKGMCVYFEENHGSAW